MTTLNEYKDMWTTNKEKYALIELSNNRYAIIDIEHKSAVLIEDSDIAEEVKAQMKSHGNQILDKTWFNNN
ncbi:hypothetical protein ACFQZE_10745 [Paenibacillus sp. GCM10027627]|uniref:hypothetical protein n=1 Tax=unclassified Paenibacillus TaxID=185978 RepID=UPI00362C0972